MAEAPGVWELLVGAFAMMLVVEGLLPFVSPRRWRGVFEQATRLNDGQIRFIGLASLLCGVSGLHLYLG